MSVEEGKSPWGMTDEQKRERVMRERERGRENERGGEIRGKRGKIGIDAGIGTSYD